MEHVGIDVHKNQSQICILTADGELLEKRIQTRRDRFAAVLGGPSRTILIEASTESEWVARCLEELGHRVLVADPNYAPMYGSRNRRVKTDRRDARALAEACRNGTYRLAHRASDAQRHVRARLAVRDNLVRTRTRYISLIRALLRREGYRVRSGSSDSFPRRVGELDLASHLKEEIAPLLVLLEVLGEQIRRATGELEELVRGDAAVQRLQTMPCIGMLTASCFVATLDSPERFVGVGRMRSFLGLVPRERSSGEKQRKGGITKAGPPRLRWQLVEAAWRILLGRQEALKPLQDWAMGIARRRGRKVAAVALARKIAGILYAMWRDGTDFDAARLGVNSARSTAAA